MKALNVTALILVLIGGLNWGLVGLFQFNLVAALFGEASWLSRLVYILVGFAAVYGFMLVKPLYEAPEPLADSRRP
jgi:uncharacterized protein